MVTLVLILLRMIKHDSNVYLVMNELDSTHKDIVVHTVFSILDVHVMKSDPNTATRWANDTP